MSNYTEIHEHRPSTAEDLRFLEQMKQDILTSIKGTIRLDDNILKGTALIIKNNPFEEFCLDVLVRFNLNNIEHEFKFVIDEFSEVLTTANRNVMQEKLYEELSRRIAQHLLNGGGKK